MSYFRRPLFTHTATLFAQEVAIDIDSNLECGPECDQRFKAHKFMDGKLAETLKMESLYPKKRVDKHLDGLRSKLPRGHTGEPLHTWMRLPKEGTSVDLLILEQNPGHVSGKALVYEAGRLEWNGSRFSFTPTMPKKPASVSILDIRSGISLGPL